MSPALIIVNHWVHLMAAITAVGGTICLVLSVIPAENQTLNDETRPEFQRVLRRKLTPLIHGSVALLILTGLVNLMNASRSFAGHMSALYGLIFGLKFILAVILFGIAIALTISSEALARFHARRRFWLSINVLLGLVIVLLSAWLRWIPR